MSQTGDTPARRLRRRIALLCGVWFLAGAGVALAVESWAAHDGSLPLQDEAQEDYVQRLAADFQLPPDKLDTLRMILLDEERQRLKVLRSLDDQLPESVRESLARIQRLTDQRIGTLLPPDQLARYQTAAPGRPEEPRTEPR